MATTKMIAPAGTDAGAQITSEYGNYTVGSDLTVTVDSRLVDELLGAGYTVQDDDLPVGSSFKGGQHVATAGEATANTLDIETGLSSVDSMIVQILRADVTVTGDAEITEADGTITIADGASTYAITAGDVINWMALGSE